MTSPIRSLMVSRESEAISELHIAWNAHGDDILWMNYKIVQGELTKGLEFSIRADMNHQQRRVRRAIAIIRYERRYRG